jgi:cephalosporin hydroxylase
VLARDGPLALGRRVLNYSRWALEVRAAALALRAKSRGLRDVDEILDVIDGFALGRVKITAWQVRSELRQLLEAVRELRPSVVLEIGTALGGTLFAFSRVAARDALLVTIDLPEGRFGGGYYPARSRLYRSFAHGGQTVELVTGDSHDHHTAAHVKTLLGGHPVDFLFVDGDHTYEGVRADYELYAPLVRPGGLIAFHDIVPGDETLVGGVPAFWRELRAVGGATELVASWSQDAYGIGLLRVSGPIEPAAVRPDVARSG